MADVGRDGQDRDQATAPARTRTGSTLTKAEREVVLTIADDERTWTIFCDSRRLGGKLRKLAARWGVEPVRTGHGFRLTLPLRAVRFAGPRTRPDADSSRKPPSTTAHFGRRRAEGSQDA